MTIQQINLGTYRNDGTGDDLYTAFTKVNENFALLGGTTVVDGDNLGSGTGIFAQLNETSAALEFKTLTSTDNSVEITSTSTTVNLKNKSTIINDPSPQLGANLDLNGHYIYNGDAQTTVYGVDVRIITNLLEVLLFTNPNSLHIDFGTITSPLVSTYDMDMNGIEYSGFGSEDPAGINLDFGTISN